MNETDSSSPTLPETTEVLYDPNEIITRVVEYCHTIKYTLDGCIDVNSPSIFVIPNHPVTEVYIDMKNRGVRLSSFQKLRKIISNTVKN